MIDIRLSDNLELMTEIKDNTVDLIYCDILYGTGIKFKDFQDLKSIRSVIESHYIPRIKEMYRILKDTGSIYLHMDTRINHWVRCIMDDIFGYKNFRNEIIWSYKRYPMISLNSFQKMHDIILFYGKNNKVKVIKENISRPGQQKGSKSGYLKKENGKVRYYVQIERTIDDVWNIPMLNPMAKERNGYATQKSKLILERIIKASSDEGDLVADFYLGSGTTAVVCKELNRNFIGCDINPQAIEITRQRLQNDKRNKRINKTIEINNKQIDQFFNFDD